MALLEKIAHFSVNSSSTMKDALKKMDDADKKLLLVFDKERFINVLSIGDIQRAIIKNLPLDIEIKKILRKNSLIAKQEDSLGKIKSLMKKYRMELMPVVDEQGQLVNVYLWEDLFGENEKFENAKLHLPVVIMAGGKGTRLKPLTNVIPKPLIPIGEKTIIEEIMDRFLNYGCDEFYISVNYKSEIIKHYFNQLKNKKYNIKYFKENKPLGTVGSLFLIKNKIKSTFFVSNCDIIIDEDYSEILTYHKENNNELTVVSAIKHYSISYGTIETGDKGVLSALIEKPELTFQINTGFYIMEPHLFQEIPEGKFFHITHLIQKIKERKGKIGVFPINEGSWTDIGEWDKYLEKINMQRQRYI